MDRSRLMLNRPEEEATVFFQDVLRIARLLPLSLRTDCLLGFPRCQVKVFFLSRTRKGSFLLLGKGMSVVIFGEEEKEEKEEKGGERGASVNCTRTHTLALIWGQNRSIVMLVLPDA